MVSKALFYGTPVHEAAKMVAFSDEDILKNSKGEVTHIYFQGADGEAGLQENSDVDPDIFGELQWDSAKRGQNMGHIALALPVVNVNRLYGTSPTIPEMLRLDPSAVESVVYCSNYMVTKSESDNYSVGMVITEKQFEAAESVGAAIEVQCGAKAIETVLNMRGVDVSGAILHYVPVMPYAFRYGLSERPLKGNGLLHSHSMDGFYHRMLERNRYMLNLMEMGAPEILVREEYRMLQDVVDGYINNGVGKYTFLDEYGQPLDSLQTVALYIGGHQEIGWGYKLFSKVDIATLQKIAEEWAAVTQTEEDTEDSEESGDLEILENELGGVIDQQSLLFKRAEVTVRDTLKDIIKSRYPELVSSHDKLYEAGIESLKDAIGSYGYYVYVDGQTPDKDPKKDLLCGIIPHMDLIARHISTS